jgi:hypothetical protein
MPETRLTTVELERIAPLSEAARLAGLQPDRAGLCETSEE